MIDAETGIFRERRFTLRDVVKRLLDIDMEEVVLSYRVSLVDRFNKPIEGIDTIVCSAIKVLLAHNLDSQVSEFTMCMERKKVRLVLTSTGIKGLFN